MATTDLGTWRSVSRPALDAAAAHVWRVELGDDARAGDWAVLSAEEQARARRFHQEIHRARYVAAHGALRRILAGYVGRPADALEFEVGPNGKPSLVSHRDDAIAGVEFNLSHSGELALVAVALGRPVGVDLEQWSEGVEHLELAEHFFSPGERDALRGLARVPERLVEGFFAAWSRKEAYLKATGDGISRGLHHFDVALEPDVPARLLADRLDDTALDRWRMIAFSPGSGYSGALVVAAPLSEVLLLESRATHSTAERTSPLRSLPF